MNRKPPVVRKRAAGTPDRRVRRTSHALTQALVDLMLEKRYDAITIQDLLDRADVGRSTFYSHYRGKDDLLLRSFGRMLELLDGMLQSGSDGARRLDATPDAVVVPVPVFARAYAGALFALLHWWLREDAPYSPEAMDRMLHALLRPA
jgi:AcrR family transcriptional regulator